jgi:hypothetical protein
MLRFFFRRRFALVSFASIAAASTAAIACSDAESTSVAGRGAASGHVPADAPLFHRDVRPILERSCQSCHAPDGMAPFSLLTYEQARTFAPAMVVETEARRMPPWGARETDECQPPHPFRGDARLTDEQIATLAAWSMAGTPEGDPADAPPSPMAKPRDLPGVDVEVSLDVPYSASGTIDDFRCFIIDPKLTDSKWIDGVHVIPGNPGATHHVDVYADPSGQGSALAGPDGSYPCFSDPMIDEQRLLHTFNPGMFPLELPPGVAMELPAGSLLALQVHYHPAGTTLPPDDLKVQLRFVDEAPEQILDVVFLGNSSSALDDGDGLMPGPGDGSGGPEFLIPANAANHVEAMRITWRASWGSPRVLGAAAHMHYVGRDMKIEVEHPGASGGDAAGECLLQEPSWNIAWQRLFLYDTAIDGLPRLSAGDRLRLRCTYDNTMQNPGVVRALADQGLHAPIDVRLGEQVVDEMCLAILPLLYPN